jgi:flavorubredoxin
MKAYVVYESLWGNTAAIAEAVAQGLGEGAVALSTADATPDVVAGADLLVAGAPSHANGLPSDSSRENALERSREEDGPPEPDLSHPSMRSWLEQLPPGKRLGAAFDTRMESWWASGPAKKIARRLRGRGVDTIDAETFTVDHEGQTPHLAEGELERARTWGRALAEKSGLDRGSV